MSLFSRSTTPASKVPAAATAPSVFDAPTAAVDDIAGDYTLDITHTRIGFSARHAMVTTVRGQFTEFEGAAHIDTRTPPRRPPRSTSAPPASAPARPTATRTSAPATSSTPRRSRSCPSSRAVSPARTRAPGPSPAT